MGQKPSNLGGNINRTKLPFWWLLLRRKKATPNPEQPIKFQFKVRRKSTNHHQSSQLNNISSKYLNNNNATIVKNEVKCRIVKTQNIPNRTKSEPNLYEKREKHRHRRAKSKVRNDWIEKSQRLVNDDDDDDDDEETQQFGYDIQDVDAFLNKATIDKPANIPVVLAFPSVLYQTRIGGYQAEISLPLGMVVNAVFKNEHWLYVQTPHAEEGYVSYAACLPLGIIPSPDDDKLTPCWENSTDVFPKPSGNMTDTEKLSSKSEYGDDDLKRKNRRTLSRNAFSTCDEQSVDRLYLRAASAKRGCKGVRQTLLLIISDYKDGTKNSLQVKKGDVVFLLGTHVKGWFWVRNKQGAEGFIPSAVAGHGFL